MQSLGLGRYALAIGAATALLAGCSGSQPPIGAPGALASPTVTAASSRQASPKLPRGQRNKLLYVGTRQQDAIFIYTYPNVSLVGQINDPYGPMGLCSDGDGNVFVTNPATNEIVEFAHGGTTPIATLTEDASQAAGPRACAIDPLTGDLAVANNGSNNTVAIFKGAQGSPSYYAPANLTANYFCGYDDHGNLFIDGATYGSHNGFGFSELAKNTSTIIPISVKAKIASAGAVEWDGKHMTVGSLSKSKNIILRLIISGSTATVVGTTDLDGAKHVAQYLIRNSVLIAPYARPNSGAVHALGSWAYPSGGEPNKLLEGAKHSQLYGVALSVAKPQER